MPQKRDTAGSSLINASRHVHLLSDPPARLTRVEIGGFARSYQQPDAANWVEVGIVHGQVTI